MVWVNLQIYNCNSTLTQYFREYFNTRLLNFIFNIPPLEFVIFAAAISDSIRISNS